MTSDQDPRPSVAMVGLGSMGAAMASALLADGWDVAGFDPSPSASEAAAAAGVRVVGAPAELARTRYLVLSLPSAAVVRDTMPILLSACGPEVIVDTTTSEPFTSREMAALATDHGAHFIDAPVSGGKTGALEGRLTAFVGGAPDAVERARPLLQSLTGGGWRHLGSVGAGNVVKLLNNVLAAANLVSVGEALAVGQAYGLDLGTALGSINGASGGSRVSDTMYPNWILSGTHDSGFALGLMARDAALAVEVAARMGEHPRLLAATSKQWQRALSELGADADFTEIARFVAPSITHKGPSTA